MKSAALSIKKSWIFWIVLVVSIVYVPFLGYRGLRMAGDEKVYVSQALEMAAHGNWFVQRLQDQPDYYKGPLHYLLLRLGLIMFGKSAWAALYMNFVFLIVGAISVGALVRKHCPKWNGGPIWAGTFFATCIGVYAHAFASQMEVELASLFALALYLLDRMEVDSPGFAFWIVAGIIGWSKSPIHSVFVGTSAILFSLISGQLWTRLKSWRCWAAVLTGALVCVAGYLPAYFLDNYNFIGLYVVKENMSKTGGSGQHWSVSWVSLFGFYLFPWLLLCLVAYSEAAWNLISGRFRNYPREVRRALLLAICWIIPSCAFWTYHAYHFENYNLPVISGVVLFISLILGNRSPKFNLAYRIATVLTALILLLVPIGLSALHQRFAPLPSWWPGWLVPFAWITTCSSVVILIYYGWFKKLQKMHALAMGMLGFYLTLGAVMAVIGERELVDLRDYLGHADATGDHVSRIAYYNMQQNIWSEWGFLNLWTDRAFFEVHKTEDVKRALLEGVPLIVPAHGPLDDFRDFTQKELPGVSLEMIPWKRWRSQGKSESGDPLWLDAWKKRDLSLLEIDFFIVRKSAH